MRQVKISVINGAGQIIFHREVAGGVVLTDDRTIEVKRRDGDNDGNSDDDDAFSEHETVEQSNTLTILPGHDHMIIIEND